MPVQTLYEVHTLKSGIWMVDSTYPDRDTAINVAKSLHGEKQFEAVKVIKDTFDESTGDGKEIVVFDTTSKITREKPPPPTPPPPPPAKEKPVAVVTPSRRLKPTRLSKGKNTKSDYAMSIKATLLLVLILGGGLGIIYLLHYAAGSFQKFL